ncbi:MAG: efflux RND transporter periplasmic adaptor subunit [Fuerstiella sp.]
MKFHLPQISLKFAWPITLFVVALVANATRGQWWPGLNSWVESIVAENRAPVGLDQHGHADVADDSHAGHGHAAHDEATSLELSDQALQNLGLTDDGISEIRLTTFSRSITVPALVVERPGRTRIQVATPMTGVITGIHAAQGEAVEPNSLLFEIRLTHEDLVRAQTEFVTTLGELDIEKREIVRLSDAAAAGGVARKTLLDRQYASDKLESLLIVQKEALRLHGLSDDQVNQIARNRRLLRELKVYSPNADGSSSKELKLSQAFVRAEIVPVSMQTPDGDPPLIFRELLVHRGQAVDAGEPLGTLVNYSELYIEGMAFEQDIAQLSAASRNGWKVIALFDEADGKLRKVPELDIAYLDTEIDRVSRTLKFFVGLPNELTHENTGRDNIRFVNWRYRPGQRLQLRVPVERWEKQIVLPVDAVAREGAEYFVFQQNGDHFDRLPVHVKYRDQFSVVVANDGQLFPGDVVAMRSAHQMQMALKNKAGGGVDPHAGHNH